MLNKWSAVEAKRAETTWGDKYPEWLVDMYNFTMHGAHILDLGCGFGRFPSWLSDDATYHATGRMDFNYTGYDSSEFMLKRFRKKR